jgi:LmbE family N-acetylglucosaminyl deacetylase
MMTKGPVLAVVAHPDDEVLGCGGTLARHAADGQEVHILIVAEGATSRDATRDAAARAEEIHQLQASAARCAAALGATAPRFGGFADNRLDGVDLLDIVKTIEAQIAVIKPALVYTHCAADLNIDHNLVHAATITACRPLPGGSVTAIYTFETPSSTEWASQIQAAFRPVRFVDIASTFAQKLNALDAYASEMRDFPHPRSYRAIEALATWRGASAGMPMAEAFEVVREILN